MVNFIKYIKMIPHEALEYREECRFNTENTSNVVLVIDLDYCLYTSQDCLIAENQHSINLENKLISEYLANNTEAKDIEPMTFKEMKSKYNNAREGIMKFYGKSMEFIVEHIFNDIGRYIEKNDELIEILKTIPVEKYGFTNGFQKRAETVMKKLELEDLFSRVYCVYDGYTPDQKWVAKPIPNAFRFVQRDINRFEKKSIIFFDDKAENLKVAETDEFNWKTYHVTADNDIVSRLKQFKREYNL